MSDFHSASGEWTQAWKEDLSIVDFPTPKLMLNLGERILFIKDLISCLRGILNKEWFYHCTKYQETEIM